MDAVCENQRRAKNHGRKSFYDAIKFSFSGFAFPVSIIDAVALVLPSTPQISLPSGCLTQFAEGEERECDIISL